MVRTVRSLSPARGVAAVAALCLLVVTFMPGLGFVGSAHAASTFNAEDYAQCANGALPSTATNCPDSWINGILNPNDSHYRENEVTAQRLQVDFDTAGTHTVTLKYLDRTGGAHAYDSLATWNATQSTADRCQDLPTGTSCIPGPATTFPIPLDSAHVPPIASPVTSSVVSDHSFTGQVFTMYGGTITSTSAITHDADVANSSKDDYAHITITFTIPANNSNGNAVQLLFGGHLAAGGGPNSWGPGLGASSISGGNYHIKWDLVDGVAIGNRDNQIMSNAVLPAQNTSIATVAHRSAAVIDTGVTIWDVASVTPSTAQGTVDFHLFSDSGCTAPVAGYTSTGVPLSSGSATSATYTVPQAGTWYWIADFHSSDTSKWTNASGACGDANESISVGKASPTITTQASPTTGTAGVNIAAVGDTATFHSTTGMAPTGSVTFTLYSNNTCTTSTGVTGSGTIHTSAGVSTASYSQSWTPPATGTFYWKASYAGDTNNNGFTTTCGDNNEQIVIGNASPTITTQASPTTGTAGVNITAGDTATFHDTNVAPTGSVTFTLYSDDSCSTSTGVTGSGTISTDSTTHVSTASYSQSFTPPAAGTYYWKAHYAGDGNNDGFTTGCGDANEEIVVSKASPTITTVADAATGTSGVSLTAGDTATFHDTNVRPTGSVTFTLYSDDSCSTSTGVTGSGSISSGSAPWTASYSQSFTPPAAGTYYWIASYAGDNNNNSFTTGCGDAHEEIVVGKASPTITTVASPSTGTSGVTVTAGDTATFHDTTAVAPTGSVTFTLYSDASCGTSTGVTGSGSISTDSTTHVSTASYSQSFTPPGAGTYYWKAAYAGDTNNDGFTTGCGDANEELVVGNASPTITTVADPNTGVSGVAMTAGDTATFHNTTSVAPTGSVTFTLYSDDACTSSTGVSGSGSISTDGTTHVSTASFSHSFTPPAAGTYYWKAAYAGDANNDGFITQCGDDNEQISVLPASPTITTVASPASGVAATGMTAGDTATFHNTTTVPPTGSVTFTLFSDASCLTPTGVSGSGSISTSGGVSTASYSQSFTPASAGTYYWIASYAGDKNNNGFTTQCGDDNEQIDVAKTTPGIVTRAQAGAVLADSQLATPSVTVQDSASLPGATPNAGGSVTFTLYGPTVTNTPDCSGTAVGASTNGVQAGQAVSDPITVSAPGYYWWVATYTGDANNSLAAGQCGDENEVTHVTQGHVGLSKTADPAPGSILQPGQRIDYTVSIPNTGDANVTDATVTDTLPAYVVVDESSITGGTFAAGSDITKSAGTITWTGVDVAAGGSTHLTYSVNVSDNAPQGEVLTNLVQMGSLSATTQHQVAAGGLTLVKHVDKATANYGDTLTYTFDASTTGTLNQHSVVVTDVVPKDTTYVSNSAKCTDAGPCTTSYNSATRTVTWQLGDMAAGTTRHLLFKVTINTPTFDPAVGLPPKTILNSGVIASHETGSTPSNVVKTTVVAVLGVKVVKKPPQKLPFTGVPAQTMVTAALLMLGAGIILSTVRRRRED